MWFNGNVSSVQVTILNITQQYSIAVWIYASGWGEGDGGTIFSTGNTITDLRIRNSTQGLSSSSNSGGDGACTSSPNVIKLNQWQHIVYVHKTGNCVFYVDGVNKSNANDLTTGTFQGIRTFGIGNGDTSTTTSFNGTMDEFSLWNRSLTPEDAVNLYKRGAMSLNLTVRSCDDAVCDGEELIDINLSNSTSSNLSSLANNRFMQYQANFFIIGNLSALNTTFSPELYNVTVHYSAVLDTTAPVVNTTFNNTSPLFNDVINFSGNITDETGLLSANITINYSTGIVKINYTISGTTASIYNVTAITGCVETCVINFTMYATDTSNNVKQNSTLITVADRTAPVVNTSLNK